MVDDKVFESMDPDVVLRAANGVSARKHRLFVCGNCGRFWDRIVDPRSKDSVRIGELYADRRTTKHALLSAYNQASEATLDQPDNRYEYWFPIHACKFASAWKIRRAAHEVSWVTALILVPDAKCWEDIVEKCNMRLRSELETQIALLKDLFACPGTIDPRWRTAIVGDLARTIYDDRAFDKMPILADALMDAGCDDERIIQHCRNDKVHMRGCWLVDLLLNMK